MGKRILSGIAVAAAAAAALCFGGSILAALLFLVSCTAYRELCRAVKISEKGRVDLLESAGYLGIVLYYLLIVHSDGGRMQADAGNSSLFFMMLCIGMLVVFMMVYVFTFPKYHSEQVMAAYFNLFYAPVMLSFIYLTERMSNGFYLVWMIFISSWICDTCAYFTGMALGRHKLAPVLSPKKSIEGAVGGAAGSAVVGALYGLLVGNHMAFEGNLPLIFAVICGIGAVISQIGDLAASAIKRNHEIKDYGRCIPGHGGIMDRFDSVIFTAPMIYFMARLWIGA